MNCRCDNNSCCDTRDYCKCGKTEIYLCDSPVISVTKGGCGTCIDNMCGIKTYKSSLCNVRSNTGYPKPSNCKPKCIPKYIPEYIPECKPKCEPKYIPKMNYEELCDRKEIKHMAMCIQYTYSTCNIYGTVEEIIKEVPSINLYIVNYEFINLCVDEILCCLNTGNLSKTTAANVKNYVDLYYEYYGEIEMVGSLHINEVVALDETLMVDPVKVNRTKAVLYAIDDRLNGEVYQYEQ